LFMRLAWLVGLVFLTACASEKLALAPPSGVDFTGRWKLDEADSDDPMRIVQSQMGAPGTAAGDSGSSGGRRGQGGGRGGRGGGQGGRGGAGPGAGAPSVPAVGALSEGLHWPGKELEIKQVAGVVAITSAGDSRVYQPVADVTKHRHRKRSDNDGAPRDRDMRPRDRDDGPPPVCGWDDKTLVVQSGAPDDDHPPFEERYSVSEDGQRLIEVVGFKGSRSGGFTMSRVWERVQGGNECCGKPSAQ
jgi:hypothetical protein